MKTLLMVIGFVAVWYMLQAWILPKFGIKTWLVPGNRQVAGEKVKAAEAKNEEVVLAAEAAAKQKRLDAAADRYRKEQDAKGLLAQGLAEARVAKEKRDARYAGESGLRQTQVEIMKSREAMFQNMKLDGIIPEKTALTIINGGPTPALTIPATK